LFVWRTAGASSIADEIYRGPSGNLPAPLEQTRTVAAGACATNSPLARQLATEKIFDEYRQALKTAELDSRQRPIRFTIFGKVHTAIYDGEALTGFEVNGKLQKLSVDEPISSPKTLFIRDENDVLKAAFTLDPQSSMGTKLRLPQELLLSASDAKSQIARIQQTSAVIEPMSKDREIEVLPSTPCYICDFEASNDLGMCGVIAGAILGADFTFVGGVCFASVGIACGFSVAGGAVGVGIAYNVYNACADSARSRLRQCRDSCS
jgi:hypothetical protein